MKPRQIKAKSGQIVIKSNLHYLGMSMVPVLASTHHRPPDDLQVIMVKTLLNVAIIWQPLR
jgi:hypothetical protein